MFRPVVIGRSLVAIGFASSIVAFCLIAKSGGGLPYMYAVWGLGLLAMSLGFNFLAKKKQLRKSPSAEQSPMRARDNSRDVPAIEEQKSLACEIGVKCPPGVSNGELSDLIAEERAPRAD